MIRNALLGSVAAIALSGSAFAADLPAKKAPLYAPPVFTWTGFYVGGTVGAVGLNTRHSNDLGDDNYVITGASTSVSGGGAAVGATVGYNYQIGQLVLGLEGDYSLTTAGTSFGSYGVSGSAKLNGFGTIRGRLGYALDRSLFYVTGGVAFADLKAKTFLFTDDPGCRASFKGKTGWTVGAGFEYALTDHVSVKLEGLYADFGKKNNVPVAGCSCRYGFKSNALVGRAGVNYKF